MPDSLGGKRMAIRVAEPARAGLTPDWMPGAVVAGTTLIWVRSPTARGTWKTIDILACPDMFRPHPRQIASARCGYEE